MAFELSESSDESQFDAVVDERYQLKRGSHPLGLSVRYVPEWTPQDAFREYFQNWVDGMAESNEIGRNFKYYKKNTATEWVMIAVHPTCGRVLGFIRFLKDKGQLELTNFGASLRKQSLDLGVSSKQSNRNMAGAHGEGFKVASLVMVREGYPVRYESSKFYWRFKFGGREKSHLYCFLTQMSENKLNRLMQADSNTRATGHRELKGHIWEDVTVRIGNIPGSGRNFGEQIEFSDFEEWIKISFDLCPPAHYIRTNDGDLVFDKTFRGKMFLKGLLLGFGSTSMKEMKLCYNLAKGKVNRDRERLMDADEEASVFAKIWEEAIVSDPKRVLSVYVEMLLEDDKSHWADVSMAEKKITRATAIQIWSYLREQKFGKEHFFYHRKTADQDVRTIGLLRKQPVPLPTCLWETLRNFELIRTPREQQVYLLHSAPVAKEVFTPYASGFKRALNAVMSLHHKARDFSIVFREGDRTDLSLLLMDTKLEINDKCLDFSKGHKIFPCQLSRQVDTDHSSIEHFSCHHIILDLVAQMQEELQRQPEVEVEENLLQRASDCLQQMPLVVQAKEGERFGEIEVTWVSLDGAAMLQIHNVASEYRVTLHRDIICSNRRQDLLAKQILGNEFDKHAPPCGCTQQLVSTSKAIFKGLDPSKKYFPMVSRDDPEAFFGLPSASIKPNSKASSAENIGPDNWGLYDLPSPYYPDFRAQSNSEDTDPLDAQPEPHPANPRLAPVVPLRSSKSKNPAASRDFSSPIIHRGSRNNRVSLPPRPLHQESPQKQNRPEVVRTSPDEENETAQWREEINRLKKELNELNEEIRNLKGQLQDKEARVAETEALEAQLSESEAIVTSLESQLEEANTRVEQLQEDVERAEAAFDAQLRAANHMAVRQRASREKYNLKREGDEDVSGTPSKRAKPNGRVKKEPNELK